jgi:ATP-dependent DNA ligase
LRFRPAIRWHPHKLVFYAFDILHLDGDDLRDQALLERRATLKQLFGRDRTSPLQFSDEFTGDSAAFFRACAEHGLEGVVSKLAHSRYRSGRSKTWLKSKCFTESELTLLGIDRDRKTGALRALLAKSERGQVVYAGPAFIALRGEQREALEAKLAELAQDRPLLSWLRNREARWVWVGLSVKVKHLAGARLLRHATVRELQGE